HSRKRENSGIFVGSLDSPDSRTRLLEDISNAEYAQASPSDTASGYLLFVRSEVLVAQKFDAVDRHLRGDAFPIVEKIARMPSNLSASFSASEDGVLFVSSTYVGDQVTWFDRTGNRLGTIGRPGFHQYPQLSPDERTVVFDEVDGERFLF